MRIKRDRITVKALKWAVINLVVVTIGFIRVEQDPKATGFWFLIASVCIIVGFAVVGHKEE